jgi:6-pyruvoyltetrahydropterin/6-carboxytetrahydropterin synthase
MERLPIFVRIGNERVPGSGTETGYVRDFQGITFEAAHHWRSTWLSATRTRSCTATPSGSEVCLGGEPDKDKNWLYDFGEIDKEVIKLRAVLDHAYLNDIDGLRMPTLENISRWIWRPLQNQLPGLDRVLVRRGSCGEGCVYSDRAA